MLSGFAVRLWSFRMYLSLKRVVLWDLALKNLRNACWLQSLARSKFSKQVNNMQEEKSNSSVLQRSVLRLSTHPSAFLQYTPLALLPTKNGAVEKVHWYMNSIFFTSSYKCGTTNRLLLDLPPRTLEVRRKPLKSKVALMLSLEISTLR